MAAKDRAAKAGKAAKAARNNPYLQRLAEDPELRETIRTAYQSAHSAYDRLANGKAPGHALMNDKKLQKELKAAATSLKEAGDALREGPKRKRKRRGRKLLLLLVVGGLALALSEGLRKKVLDTLFGAEEEFEYTSTTTATPSPEPAGTTT